MDKFMIEAIIDRLEANIMAWAQHPYEEKDCEYNKGLMDAAEEVRKLGSIISDLEYEDWLEEEKWRELEEELDD